MKIIFILLNYNIISILKSQAEIEDYSPVSA